MSERMPHSAVLLIAHGSRRREANADLYALAKMVAPRLGSGIVEVAFLELTEPTIPEGAARCVARGATEVVLLPYFLSAGVHVVTDLAEYRDQFSEQYPAVTFRLAPPLGLHPLMVDILLARLAEAEAGPIAAR